MVSIGKALQDPIDLLGLLWQLHLHQQFPDSHVHRILEECEGSHVAPEYSLMEGVVGLGQDASHGAPADRLLQSTEILPRRVVGLSFRNHDRVTSEMEGV